MRCKTFKREIAAIALIFWSVLTIRMFWGLEIETIKALDVAYGTASTSIWLYVAAAFGMDAFSKQLRRTPGPSVSEPKQVPSKTGQQAYD